MPGSHQLWVDAVTCAVAHLFILGAGWQMLRAGLGSPRPFSVHAQPAEEPAP